MGTKQARVKKKEMTLFTLKTKWLWDAGELESQSSGNGVGDRRTNGCFLARLALVARAYDDDLHRP